MGWRSVGGLVGGVCEAGRKWGCWWVVWLAGSAEWDGVGGLVGAVCGVERKSGCWWVCWLAGSTCRDGKGGMVVRVCGVGRKSGCWWVGWLAGSARRDGVGGMCSGLRNVPHTTHCPPHTTRATRPHARRTRHAHTRATCGRIVKETHGIGHRRTDTLLFQLGGFAKPETAAQDLPREVAQLVAQRSPKP